MSSHPPIQVVDTNGALLGLAKSPNEAKAARQIRAISRITLSDESGGRYLLQKRAGHMDAWPGRWDHSAAGHIDEGETADAAAHREMAEEIGLSGCRLTLEKELFFEHPPEADGSQNRMYNYFYSGVFTGNIEDLTLDPDEVSEVRWFTKEEIIAMLEQEPNSVTDGIRMLFEAG